MTARFVPNSMSLPPPRRQPAWVPTRRSGDSSPAPIAFVSKLVVAALAIVLGAAVIATAPRTVTLPIAVALAAGLLASGFTALVVRWRAVLGIRPDRQRSAATVTPAVVQERARSHDDALFDESMRERGWIALGVVSMAVLGLAIVVPNELAVAFAAIGIAGLVVFRLTAAWVGWTPDRTTRVKSSVPTESRTGTPPRLASS